MPGLTRARLSALRASYWAMTLPPASTVYIQALVPCGCVEYSKVRVPSALSQICVGVPRVARTSVSSRRALGGGVLAQAPSRAQRMTREGRVRMFMGNQPW